jgi:uncharacterized protein (TIGR00266 family)
MEYKILKEPMAILEIQMSAGERITAESGAMVYMRGEVEIQTRSRKGGLWTKVKVSTVGNESFFVNDFVAVGDCAIGLTGPPIGDIVRLEVKPGSGYIVQSGTYIASTQDVSLDTQWQGFTRGLFGSEFFMLKATGQGDLFVNAYGSIIHKDLLPDENIAVDNHHLVAMGEQVSYEVVRIGGLKTALLGGEGLAVDITGPGPLYIQTKNMNELASSIARKAKSS